MIRLRIFVVLLILAVGLLPAWAQESNPTDANRANELAWILYVRNAHNVDLIANLQRDDYVQFQPFAPQGGAATAADVIKGEGEYQASFPDMHFVSYIVLAEGDFAAYAAYQEGTFKNAYLGTEPTGKFGGGQLMTITQFTDGKAIRDYTAWNQQSFMQDLGWAPADYTFAGKPWNVKLGVTGSTPAEHHQSLQAIYNALATKDVDSIAAYYESDVLAHDYLKDVQGIAEVQAVHRSIITLPDFKGEESHIVCEGDLCISWALASVKANDDRTYIIWSALHRFVDGKIAEEWWLYDNAALWPLLPTNT